MASPLTRSLSCWQETEPLITIDELFNICNFNAVPENFLNELRQLDATCLRAIYLVCMVVTEDTLVLSDADLAYFQMATTIVHQSPVPVAALAETVLLLLARKNLS